MLAKSERVQLRRLVPVDLAAFIAYRSDPEVVRYQGWSEMDEARSIGFLFHAHNVRALALRARHSSTRTTHMTFWTVWKRQSAGLSGVADRAVKAANLIAPPTALE